MVCLLSTKLQAAPSARLAQASIISSGTMGGRARTSCAGERASRETKPKGSKRAASRMLDSLPEMAQETRARAAALRAPELLQLGQQLCAAIGLLQVARAGQQHVLGTLRIARHEQHLQLGTTTAQLGRNGRPSPARHGDVAEQHVDGPLVLIGAQQRLVG